jgi:enediyne polyketide synthase
MACRYPDADNPDELWANVLTGRRAFRQIPDERMRLADYWSPDPAEPDRFYNRNAAVIEGFEFDRVHFKIAGSTYRATDLTHWLALDTAARALVDAGFAGGDGLPKRSTAVIIGNTLTGEFARANLMRLRWPYVRRVVSAALREHGWGDGDLAEFLRDLEGRYKSPFPPIDEDSLAGGLSNTIAGRITNQFDFKGGCFTVDGACSSSLLSVAVACNALVSHQVDAVVAGGVDLSIDPFEVIGFAKTGALATGDMRVYDKYSNGFWPGEGCGMLVLLRQADADAKGLRSYATIAGWGYASDGRGGITRPDADGHQLAVDRAYQLAGFDIGTVGYLEGHGTGTAVGDETELRALSQARRQARPEADPAAISTIKGNIGHTKAAAGVAGLIKATLAVHHQVIPPATGHHDTHPELAGPRPALRVPLTAELWPADHPVRAGVSAMGFGGIDTHVILENRDGTRRTSLDPRTVALQRSRQDCEILLLDADMPADLRERALSLAILTARLAFAELGDLAATLQQDLAGRNVRAAIVAASPQDATRRLTALAAMLAEGVETIVDPAAGVFLGRGTASPRIGYLFPGQGSGKRNDGGAIARRFDPARELYQALAPPSDGDLVATAVAQPRIATSSVAGLRVLALLGIEATAAVGHSLGELTCLHWAGAMSESALLDLAAARGRVMAHASAGDGAMASVAASPADVEPMLHGEPVVIAGYNGPRQTVISGPADAIDRICGVAGRRGMTTTRINVSHAFHSPSVAPAAEGLGAYLAGVTFQPLARRVLSSVTSDALPPDTDLRDLLVRQVLEPVRFHGAVRLMAADVDLMLEVGPGRVLSGLAADIAPGTPCVALDTDSASLTGLLTAVAAAYALGAPVRHDVLFGDRFTRPLPLDKEFRFFASPCELAPADDDASHREASQHTPGKHTPGKRADGAADGQPADGTTDGQPADGTADGQPADGLAEPSINLLRRLMAERAELPLDAVRPDSQPLDDLHFSSITVGQIVNQATRELGVSALVATASFATATLADLAQMLDDLAGTELPGDAERGLPEGVRPWVRAFAIALVQEERRPRAVAATPGGWRIFATHGHPLAGPLADALRAAELGDGVLLCLPSDCDERHIGLMLDAAHAAVEQAPQARFVVVGDRRGAAGLAKTLHLEAPAVATCVVTMPIHAAMPAGAVKDAADWIAADVACTTGFSEVHYDEAGTRRVPVLRPVARAAADPAPPLGAGDVVLVTGGGKGITAECALALAAGTGAAVGLLGRSDPAADAELAANLSRMDAAGVAYFYARADVTSRADVTAAVAQITAVLGPVTALLHGAGRNEPKPIAQLDEAAFAATLAPKIAGLDAVLDAVNLDSLRLLVTFGSIIGRAGLRGQADYATANDWLTELTRRVSEAHPRCRCLALEWSVWAGAGMGERLGVLESLTREGISPITVDDGIATLRELIATPDLPTALVVMGRAGGLPTIALEPRELPLARFLDRPRVYYPGIELVADAELSTDSDLYLADHALDDELLFPAVFGIEAMTQAASVLAMPRDWPGLKGPAGRLVLEDVEFRRPIVVTPGGSVGIRVAALNRGDSVDVVIRCSDTSFSVDHFSATLRWITQEQPDPVLTSAGSASTGSVSTGPASDSPSVLVDPGRDLYGGMLFQGKRFQRVLGYQAMAATSCVAEISTVAADSWFSAFFPAGLLLGDPGARDAFMHAIQCCVPNATLLPEGVARIYPGTPRDGTTRVILSARERHRDGDSYTYDLDVSDPSGVLVERWEGLRLRAVRKQDGSGPWVPALLGPFLERQLAELYPQSPRVVVEPDGPRRALARDGQRKQTAIALSRILGRPTVVRYRRDGKPEVDADVSVSVSHGAGLTLAVAMPGQVGCDAEAVVSRTANEWQLLLGAEQFALAELVARERGEDLAVSATRVWGAMECLRKVGRALPGSITLGESSPAGWVLLRAGTVSASRASGTVPASRASGTVPASRASGTVPASRASGTKLKSRASGTTSIATFVTHVRDEAAPMVFAILTGAEN